MSDEDRKYLRSIKKMRPSFVVFQELVKILKSIQKKTDLMLQRSSLENSNM